MKLNYQSVILEQSYISASIYRTLSFKKENLMTINTLQCPVSWLYMQYCLEGRFAWWQLAQTKSIRPMCICRSLSLRKRNKHGKTGTAHVASKVNSGLSTLHVFKYWELMGREDRWRHNACYMTSFVQKHTGWLQSSQICDDTKHVKKMLLALLYLSWLVYILPSHYYNAMLEFMRKHSMLTLKIAQTKQNIWNLACQQRSCSQGIWNVIVGKSGLLKKCMSSHYH